MSRKIDYGLRAMIHLAGIPAGKIMSLQDLATTLHLPRELAGFARLRRLNVAIRASNLLDRKYADTGFFIDLTQEERLSPAPGRSFTVSLTLD